MVEASVLSDSHIVGVENKASIWLFTARTRIASQIASTHQNSAKLVVPSTKPAATGTISRSSDVPQAPKHPSTSSPEMPSPGFSFFSASRPCGCAACPDGLEIEGRE